MPEGGQARPIPFFRAAEESTRKPVSVETGFLVDSKRSSRARHPDPDPHFADFHLV